MCISNEQRGWTARPRARLGRLQFVTEGGRLAWALAQESCASPRFHFFRVLEPYRIEPKSFKHTSTSRRSPCSIKSSRTRSTVTSEICMSEAANRSSMDAIRSQQCSYKVAKNNHTAKGGRKPARSNQRPREMLFTRAAHSIATSVIGFSVAECSV
jgi:hypothetical protein